MKRLKKMSYTKRQSWVGFAFVCIWLIGFIQFFLRPLIMAVDFSFGTLQFMDTGYEVIRNGVANYRRALFEDSEFIRQIWNSFADMVSKVPLIVLVSLLIAVLLKPQFRGRTFFRAVFFIPVIVITGQVQGFIQGDQFAVMALEGTKSGGSLFEANSISVLLTSLEVPSEISNMVVSSVNTICNLIWQSGMQIILLLTGLNAIPGSLYEASSIEGATTWDVFWKIELPMVAPTIHLCVIYTIIDTFVNSNNKLMNRIVTLIQAADFSFSSTLIVIYAVAVLIFVLIVHKILSRFTEQAID